MSFSSVSWFCLHSLCLNRFLSSIKGISSSSEDVSLSCLYRLANLAKGMFSSDSESASDSDSEGWGGIA